ncbi:MAG TPA: transglycosylase, partial [Caulobacteraceae bacterium]|nr:transglycosylase [Caulobacteraceae bacterium]
MFSRALLAALASLTLAACSTTPPRQPEPWEQPPPRPQPTKPPVTEPRPQPPVTLDVASLPGWANDDHAAAFAAWRQTCHVARDPSYAAVCARARAEGPLTAAEAR